MTRRVWRKAAAAAGGALVAIVMAAVLGVLPVAKSAIPPEAPPIGPLSSAAVPRPANIDQFVRSRPAAVKLGKALFWDMQVGSDGLTACASCHFAAGADARAVNQLNPGEAGGFTTFDGRGVNQVLSMGDFPFHALADPNDPNSAVVRDTRNVAGSQGVAGRDFIGVDPGGQVDPGPKADDPIFSIGGINVRRVTGRNSPSVINAVFNHRQFWDGRAQNIFNGVNPFGNRDPDARVVAAITPTQLALEAVSLDNSSLASQAVGPPLSSVEMSVNGRAFRDLGKKMLHLVPLDRQRVSAADSVLGPVARPDTGLTVGYEDLIRQAFQPRWWNGNLIVRVSAGGPEFVPRPARPLAANEYTLTQYNFALYFGLAIQEYESTLVSDQTPFDRFMEGDAPALNAQERRGLQIFDSPRATCSGCHAGPELTSASVAAAGPLPIETMLMGDGTLATYDNGFYNIGVRPTAEDIGVGGTDPFGNPLSITRFLGTTGRIADRGSFKTPSLRNVELTAPYMHNGGQGTLEQVVQFYNRGADFAAQNIADLDPEIGRLGLTQQERDDLVAFLKALTDPRVKNQSAPFDHPQLFVSDGHPTTAGGALVDDGSGIATDRFIEIPATGAAGGAPLAMFPNLNGPLATPPAPRRAPPPDTVVDTAPPQYTTSSLAAFTYHGSDSASSPDRLDFECSLDGAAFGPCPPAGTSFAAVAPGRHTFDVRAVNSAGASDATPATWTWDVHAVDVSADADSVRASGYAAGQTVTVEVRRGTATVAAVTGITPADDPGTPQFDGIVAINAGAGGCWTGTTPDILAGDSVRISVDGTLADTVPVANVVVTQAATEEAGVIVVRGTAQTSSGTRIPAGRLEVLLAGGLRAPGAGTIAYDAPGIAWTARFAGLSAAQAAAAASGATTAGWTGPDPDSLLRTHTTYGETGGPAAPCEAPPATRALDLLAASDTGVSDLDDITADTTPTFTGTGAGPGNVVTLAVGGTTAGSTTAAADGSWEFTTGALADGTYPVTASEGGNPLGPPLMVTIDAAAPALALTATPPALTKSPDATFAFTSEAGATTRCSLTTAAPALAPCDSPFARAALADGSWTFVAEAEDVAGNTTQRTHTFVVDATAPGVTITSAPPADSPSAAAGFGFSTADASASLTCSLDGAAAAPCTSPATFAGLADGPHTFAVHATDPAGNVSTDTRTVRVDTRVPTVSLTAQPTALTTDNTPSFAFSGDEPGLTYTCSLTAGAESFAACTSPTTFPAQPDGALTFKVIARDAAGNQSAPAAVTFTVDTVAPVVAIGERPAARSKLSDVRFTFSSETGAGFECSLSTAADAYAPCTSPALYAGRADGSYTFKVRARDGAGNLGPAASHSFAVDTAAPVASITSGPAGPVNDTHPSFAFASEPGAVFECSLSQGTPAWSPCTSPAAYSPATDGAYTFSVRATDVAGNTSTVAQRSFVLDTAAPVAAITASPAARSADTTPDIAFSSELGATFECSLATGLPVYGPCVSPKTFGPVADGTYTARVRATDAAGNTGPAAAVTFVVDTVAPTAAISQAPSNPTNDTTPTFVFGSDDPDASYECSLATAAPSYAACTSPVTYPVMPEGAYTFRVRATDVAGNRSADAAHSLTIDTSAAGIVFSTVPAPASADTTPTFVFSATKPGTAFQCSLSTGAPSFAPCTSPLTYPAQPNGSYVFTVAGTDAAGNRGTAEVAFVIDTVAPGATILSGPPAITTSSSPTFTFSATEPTVTFECSLSVGADAFAPCASPASYVGKADGTYVFKVRATDAAGNTGAVASATFAIAAGGAIAGAPVAELRTNVQLGTAGQFPVRLRWPAVTGATSYTLQQSLDGGAWSAIALPSATATSVDRQLNPNRTYRFRVKANNGAWKTSTGFVPTLVQESAPGLVRSGAWATAAVTGASGGSVLFASAAGAVAGHTFTAVSVGWVTTRSAARGQADVYMDGVRHSSVNAYSAAAQPRRIVATASGLSGAHTIEIRVLGKKSAASSSTRVDLDAFALLVAVP